MKKLDREFDINDPAATGLEVIAPNLLFGDLPFHPSSQVVYLSRKFLFVGLLVDDLLETGGYLPGKILRTDHNSCPEERLPLPGPALFLVVFTKGVE